MNRRLFEATVYLGAGTGLALAIILGVESGRVLLEVALGVLLGAPIVVFAHVAAHAAAAVWIVGKHVFVHMGGDPALIRFSLGRADFRLGGIHPAVCDIGSLDAPPRRLAPVFLAAPAASAALAGALVAVAFLAADSSDLPFRLLVGAAGLSAAIAAANLVSARVPRWWPGAELRGETDARSGLRLLAAHRAAVESGVRPRRVGPEHIPETGRAALARAEERYESGQREAARRELEKAAASPEPETAAAAQFDLGLLARQDGDEAEARRRYEAALEAGVPGPSSAAAINLATLLERADRPFEAQLVLERAVELAHPRWTPFAQANLGDLLARVGELERAAEAYRASLAAPQHEHTARAAFRLGKLLMAQGDDRSGRAALAMAAGIPEGKYADAAREALREASESAAAED